MIRRFYGAGPKPGYPGINKNEGIRELRDGIAHCEGVRDYVSRDLLRRILDNEEEHVDFLDRQFDLIRQIGVERYIQLNSTPAPNEESETSAKG